MTHHSSAQDPRSHCRAGLTRYDALLLTWYRREGTALVWERLEFQDGRVVSGVVRQTWVRDGDGWSVGPVDSILRQPEAAGSAGAAAP